MYGLRRCGAEKLKQKKNRCGAATCAEHSYARHQHSLAKILPHVAHNEAAIRIGGIKQQIKITNKNKRMKQPFV
jgi:hypothetical protein